MPNAGFKTNHRKSSTSQNVMIQATMRASMRHDQLFRRRPQANERTTRRTGTPRRDILSLACRSRRDRAAPVMLHAPGRQVRGPPSASLDLNFDVGEEQAQQRHLRDQREHPAHAAYCSASSCRRTPGRAPQYVKHGVQHEPSSGRAGKKRHRAAHGIQPGRLLDERTNPIRQRGHIHALSAAPCSSRKSALRSS